MKVFSSQQTAAFYDGLMKGTQKRGMFGKDNRYNPQRIAQRKSTEKYFINVVAPYLSKSERILDFGCGPGSFLSALAPYCTEIKGVDISKSFVEQCQQTINDLHLSNAQAIHILPDQLPFDNEHFDCLLMVDVIHHLENIEKSLKEVFRVVKRGGRIFIFEPNKLNPLLWLMHFIDKNERGLLRLGTPSAYRKTLLPYMKIDGIYFNGIVIGPESRIFTGISEILNSPGLKSVLGWLNPKMFITGTKVS